MAVTSWKKIVLGLVTGAIGVATLRKLYLARRLLHSTKPRAYASLPAPSSTPGSSVAASGRVSRERGKATYGGLIIAETLARHGVKLIFTLTGGHIAPILVGCNKIGVRGGAGKIAGRGMRGSLACARRAASFPFSCFSACH